MKEKYQTPYDDSVHYFSVLHLEILNKIFNFIYKSVAYQFNYPINIFFKL